MPHIRGFIIEREDRAVHQLVFVHQDGSTSSVDVSDASTVTVKTYRPPRFGDEGTMPLLVEDQTFSLAGVVEVRLSDGSPVVEPVVAKRKPGRPKKLAAVVPEGEPKPWEDAA